MTALDLVRPVCHVCEGSGGHESYFGGDWTGCYWCNPNEDREEPVTRIWFWQVWTHRYYLWKLDRWVDQQVEKDRHRDHSEGSAKP